MTQIKKVWSLLLLAALTMSSCRGGINAGGETPTSNGGVAWVAMAGMLLLTMLILWLILGRDD
ncbi:MAG: hypothetical protein M3N53_04090 [Actinomycetota bacterium]|nr:hypothetical protein [Actinomycetota bacterium]